MKPNRQEVGKRIREVRTELGYSMERFGELIGDLPRSSINNWEKGVSIPKGEKLEKIAKLSGKSAGWFYYGEIEDCIYDYLLLKGEERILSDYPDIPQKIKKEFLTGEFKNPGWENEVEYPHESFIDDYFSELYNSAMSEYIFNLVLEFLGAPKEDFPLTKIEQGKIFMDITSEIYGYFLISGEIKYGEKEKIQGMIENTYKNLKTTTYNEEYLIGKLINLLKDDAETEELINSLSVALTGKNFNSSFGGIELIRFFQSLRPKLMELYSKTNDDTYYDWFEKK